MSFTTLGCRVNQYDGQALRERAAEASFREVPFESGADLVVVNTCSVTAAADSEARHLIRRALRLNPSAKVVVTGCYAQDRPGEVAALPGVALVVGNRDKPRLFDRIAGLFPGTTGTAGVSGRTDSPEDPWVGGISRFDGHRRAILKVQEGCGFGCSFCLVPRVRGGLQSRDAGQIIAEGRRLAEGGVHELVLAGIQLASYGRDLGLKTGEPRLAPVVERLLALPGVRRVRLSSYSIADFEQALLPLLGRGLCPHLHLPLQSGDPGILQAMRRPHKLEQYREVVEKVRSVVPDVGITTDLIAGFPGEDEEAFGNTVSAVREFRLADLHPFPYSDRPGTAGLDLNPKVAPGVVRSRMERLWAIKREALAASAKAAEGRPWDVVAEKLKPGWLGGTTDRGLKVAFPAGGLEPGQETQIRVTGQDGTKALGEVLQRV